MCLFHIQTERLIKLLSHDSINVFTFTDGGQIVFTYVLLY